MTMQRRKEWFAEVEARAKVTFFVTEESRTVLGLM
jgi:hypothetical protein